MVPEFVLRRRRLLLVAALSTLIALAAAVVNLRSSDGLRLAAASTHVLIDLPSTSIVPPRRNPADRHTDQAHRAHGARARVPAGTRADCTRRRHTAGRGRRASPHDGQRAARDHRAPSERRAREIEWTKSRYRLEVQARPTAPVLDIYALAPSAPEAERLANVAVSALREYLTDLATARGSDKAQLTQVRQLGTANGVEINGRASLLVAALTFFVAFAIAAGVMTGLLVLRQRNLNRRADDSPAPRMRSDLVAHTPGQGGDWPRTTRVLPWTLAVFIAMLWVVPFNVIQLNMSFPVDLKLDRLLLPIVAGAWLIALALGGAAAPRLRFTWIHAALAAFTLVAFLSVVLNAGYLSQTLEFDTAFKKLPLLVSYVLLFAITASG